MNAGEKNPGIYSPIDEARDLFKPENMGFTSYGAGWEKEIPGVGAVVFLPLSWEHGNPQVSLNKFKKGSALELVSRIQQKVFKMRRDRDAAAPAHLGNIAKRGGSVVIAFKKDQGDLNYKNWLGFGIVEGGDDQKAISEFIGVKDGFRDKDIASHLRLIQMHLALEKGKTKFELEMGPLRGRMAKKSIQKLGGYADEFILAKYPGMNYKLYGSETEDRIKVTFNLLHPKTQARMLGVARGIKQDEREESFTNIEEIPIVTGTNIEELVLHPTPPDHVRYEIPEEADTLRHREKRRWRNEMAKVFQLLLTHEKAFIPEEGHSQVVFTGATRLKRDYTITDFISIVHEKEGNKRKGRRQNFYIFTRNDLIN